MWLGWFLHESLARFMPLAEARKDAPRIARWLVHMDVLREALERDGWDGAWYRRAFFDDGFALGSAANRECRIDSIAQAWSVISKAAAPDRAARAMEAVDKYLVRPEARLLALFAPPFVASQHDPGYIKGYPAGIRENGGQYTHGVLWSIIAFAMMGNGDRAGELFAMLNPVNHARTRAEAERYRVEMQEQGAEDFQPVATVTATEMSLPNLPPTPLRLRVRAVNQRGLGPWSRVVEIEAGQLKAEIPLPTDTGEPQSGLMPDATARD